MAQSSIHIASGSSGYVYHNSREKETKNSIFKDEQNEISHTAKEAFKIYRTELAKRSKAYTERTKQQLQKKAITHLSAIVNLNQHHTLKDLEPLIKHLEQELDTKVFQVAIHRDEGHIEDGKAIKNYHAHIEFLGLDSQGYSVRKKLTKSFLSKLQDFTAESLNMQRGINYAKERKRRPKRLDTYEFKEHKKQEEKAVKQERAKVKDLKKRINELRAELQKLHAERPQYAKLEAENKELKEQIKNKNLTITELDSRIENLKEKLLHSKTNIQELETEVTELKAELDEKNRKIDILKDKSNEYIDKYFDAANKAEALEAENVTLKQQVQELEAREPEVKVVEKEKIVEVPVEKPVEKIVKVEDTTRIQELKEKLLQSDKRIETLEKNAEKLQNENVTLKQQVQELEQREPEVKVVEKVVEVEKRVEVPVEKIVKVEDTSRIQELEKEIEEKDKEIEQIYISVNETLKQKNQKIKELEEDTTKRKELESHLLKIAKAVGLKKSELTTYAEVTAKSVQKIESIKAENATLKGYLQELGKKLEATGESIADLFSSIKSKISEFFKREEPKKTEQKELSPEEREEIDKNFEKMFGERLKKQQQKQELGL